MDLDCLFCNPPINGMSVAGLQMADMSLADVQMVDMKRWQKVNCCCGHNASSVSSLHSLTRIMHHGEFFGSDCDTYILLLPSTGLITVVKQQESGRANFHCQWPARVWLNLKAGPNKLAWRVQRDLSGPICLLTLFRWWPLLEMEA